MTFENLLPFITGITGACITGLAAYGAFLKTKTEVKKEDREEHSGIVDEWVELVKFIKESRLESMQEAQLLRTRIRELEETSTAQARTIREQDERIRQQDRKIEEQGRRIETLEKENERLTHLGQV